MEQVPVRKPLTSEETRLLLEQTGKRTREIIEQARARTLQAVNAYQERTGHILTEQEQYAIFQAELERTPAMQEVGETAAAEIRRIGAEAYGYVQPRVKEAAERIKRMGIAEGQRIKRAGTAAYGQAQRAYRYFYPETPVALEETGTIEPIKSGTEQ